MFRKSNLRKSKLAVLAILASAASSAFAHPGPRVWIGSGGGTLATFTSNDDLNPTSFSPSRVFVGGVDEDTLTANGRLDEYPVAGTGIYATDFPGYQVRTDGLSGISTGSTFSFDLGPLLVFDPAAHQFKTAWQMYGNPGPAPRIGESVGANSIVSGPAPASGFSFFSYNTAGDHAHLVTALYGNGTQTVDGPHAVYAVPMELRGGGLAKSLPYYVLYGRTLGVDDAVFQEARSVAQAAVASSSGMWIADADGDWGTAGDWFANVPDAIGATAKFGGAISAPRTVSVASARTLGAIAFDSASGYTIAGPGTITLDATSTAPAALTVAAGGHVMAAPLVLSDDLVVNAGGGATLTISGTMSAAGRSIAANGAGTARFANVRASALIVNAGTVAILANGTSAGASDVGTLAIAGGQNPTATLDVADNDIRVSGGGKAMIAAQIGAARAGGAWSGHGITSSAAKLHAAHATTLGLLDGAEYTAVNGPTFDGLAVAAGDVLVKYTWYGDTDFNGIVNFDDYVRTDNGFNNHLTGWLNGDFDLNGVVNFDDYVLIDLAFNTQSGTLKRAVDFLDGTDRSAAGMNEPALDLVMRDFDRFGDGYAAAFLAAVPEPASAALLGFLGCAAAMRRRHRCLQSPERP